MKFAHLNFQKSISN